MTCTNCCGIQWIKSGDDDTPIPRFAHQLPRQYADANTLIVAYAAQAYVFLYVWEKD